jgi:hypothetical protein
VSSEICSLFGNFWATSNQWNRTIWEAEKSWKMTMGAKINKVLDVILKEDDIEVVKERCMGLSKTKLSQLIAFLIGTKSLVSDGWILNVGRTFWWREKHTFPGDSKTELNQNMTFWPVFTKFIRGHAHPGIHDQDEADQDIATWHWQEKKLKGSWFYCKSFSPFKTQLKSSKGIFICRQNDELKLFLSWFNSIWTECDEAKNDELTQKLVRQAKINPLKYLSPGIEVVFVDVLLLLYL